MSELEKIDTSIKKAMSRKLLNVSTNVIHYSHYDPTVETLCGRIGSRDYYYAQVFKNSEHMVNCKSCLKAMDSLLRKRETIEKVMQTGIPKTCTIINVIRTADGTEFSMDRIQEAIEHEVKFQETVSESKRAENFAQAVGNIAIVSEFVTSCIQFNSPTNRKTMLRNLYRFIKDNEETIKTLASHYKRIKEEGIES